MTQRLIALAASALLIATLFIGTPAPAFAADPAVTYYVAQSGTPDGDGSSCTDPDFVGGDHQPIEAAAFVATDFDTIYICAGTYAFESIVSLGGAVTVQGAGAGVTILDGDNTYAILQSSFAMTVSDITFQNAYNNNNGSAIIAPDVSLVVLSSSFVNNTAIYGSAIYNGDSGMVTIIDSTFTSNTATDSGGAVWTATAVVLDSTFTNNDAADDGGAIGTDFGNVTVSNSTFTGNTADDKGGAIYTFNTGVTVTDSTFTDNYSVNDGGAIRAYTVTATDSTFTNNDADDDGGAIRADSTATVSNSTFTNNDADDDGGAIRADSTATVSNSTFIGNGATSAGAIQADNATVTDSTFTNNDAAYYGGAIEANTATVTDSTFTNNVADAVWGGAIAAITATVTDSTFTNNVAHEYGGAIFAFYGFISNSRFTRNTAGVHGGAITLAAPSPTDLSLTRRNTFLRNTAPAGGAITLGPCTVPSRSEAASVERANRFSGNRATRQRRTNNIERWEGGC